jgi:hypothetical protein
MFSFKVNLVEFKEAAEKFVFLPRFKRLVLRTICTAIGSYQVAKFAILSFFAE